MAEALVAVREIGEDLFENEIRRMEMEDIRRERRYVVSEEWIYRFDNDFARNFITQRHGELDSFLDPKPSTKCCSWGRSTLFSDGEADVARLCKAGEGCKLCDFVSRVVDSSPRAMKRDVQIHRDGSVLKHDGQRILQLCVDPKSSALLKDQIQIRFPVLPTERRFELLGAWLKRCDDHGCKDTKLIQAFPTYLIDVGDPNILRLVSGSLATAKYIALSHCWGKPADNQLLPDGKTPRYCTTRSNFEDRRQAGFSAEDLPLTFQDAIKVARGLKVQFLWVDSLCIIQGEDGNWEEESERMQDIYTSAYLTVAATSAENSRSGFLKQNIHKDYLHVQDDSGRAVFICTDIADFDVEVDQARLNTRAWVLQERFLSCRKIHFGANQMYWECGKGVYCEDLTQMESVYDSVRYFKLDPKFPHLLLRSGNSELIRFLQSLFEDYSSRDLSNETDRAVAVSGLAVRIAKVLSCEENYGTFSRYLHRGLLWRRSCKSMTRISYKSDKVPSWSWMAYTGRIHFVVKDTFSCFEGYRNLKFASENKKVLITDLWEFAECSLKEERRSEATSRELVTLSGRKIGWISYDVESGQDLPLKGSAVVGRSRTNKSDYYILVLRQHGLENEYERIGIGMVQQDYLSRQRPDIYIV